MEAYHSAREERKSSMFGAPPQGVYGPPPQAAAGAERLPPIMKNGHHPGKERRSPQKHPSSSSSSGTPSMPSQGPKGRNDHDGDHNEQRSGSEVSPAKRAAVPFERAAEAPPINNKKCDIWNGFVPKYTCTGAQTKKTIDKSQYLGEKDMAKLLFNFEPKVSIQGQYGAHILNNSLSNTSSSNKTSSTMASSNDGLNPDHDPKHYMSSENVHGKKMPGSEKERSYKAYSAHEAGSLQTFNASKKEKRSKHNDDPNELGENDRYFYDPRIKQDVMFRPDPKERRGRTRTQMYHERKNDKYPHLSYDLDGDGVVGERDLFVSRFFDTDKKGHLTDEERKLAIHKVENEGFMDKFKFGFAATGAANPELITSQKMGKIVTCNNVNDVAENYPPRYPKDHIPKHWFAADMKIDRVSAARNYGNDFYNAYRAKKPLFVPQSDLNPEVAKRLKDKKEAQDTIANPALAAKRAQDDPVFATKLHELTKSSSEPNIHSINERAEADHCEARIRAGLFPYPTLINPEKEDRKPGLVYVYDPEIKTRGELFETRKKLMILDNDTLRRRGEEACLTPRINKAIYEAACHEMRRGVPERNKKTLTTMKDARRADKVEYDRTHFAEQPKQYHRFSDQPIEWWKLGRPEVEQPKPIGLIVDPVLKPNHNPIPQRVTTIKPIIGPGESPTKIGRNEMANDGRSPHRAGILSSYNTMLTDGTHAKKVHRILSDVHENTRDGEIKKAEELNLEGVSHRLPEEYHKLVTNNRNKKRLFDAIVDSAAHNARPQPSDHTPLDVHSSMDIIRKNAQEKTRLEVEREKAQSPDRQHIISQLSPQHRKNKRRGSSVATELSGSSGGVGMGTQASRRTVYHRVSDATQNSSGTGKSSGNTSGSQSPVKPARRDSRRDSNLSSILDGSYHSLENRSVVTTKVYDGRSTRPHSAFTNKNLSLTDRTGIVDAASFYEASQGFGNMKSTAGMHYLMNSVLNAGNIIKDEKNNFLQVPGAPRQGQPPSPTTGAYLNSRDVMNNNLPVRRDSRDTTIGASSVYTTLNNTYGGNSYITQTNTAMNTGAKNTNAKNSRYPSKNRLGREIRTHVTPAVVQIVRKENTESPKLLGHQHSYKELGTMHDANVFMDHKKNHKNVSPSRAMSPTHHNKVHNHDTTGGVLDHDGAKKREAERYASAAAQQPQQQNVPITVPKLAPPVVRSEGFLQKKDILMRHKW